MRCKACGTDRAPDEFYKSSKSRCKECVKKAATEYRLSHIDYYRQYDRMRASQPHRVAARKQYQETEAFAASHDKAVKKYLVSQPKRRAAQVAVGNALRDGKLQKLPCLICGHQAEAHHPDYDRPLDVVWLCPPHHKLAHALAKEAA